MYVSLTSSIMNDSFNCWLWTILTSYAVKEVSSWQKLEEDVLEVSVVAVSIKPDDVWMVHHSVDEHLFLYAALRTWIFLQVDHFHGDLLSRTSVCQQLYSVMGKNINEIKGLIPLHLKDRMCKTICCTVHWNPNQFFFKFQAR